MAAVSRTERDMIKSAACPGSPPSGPVGIRKRVGFSPTKPHAAAGIRIDPPPSLPCPIGTAPAATIAAVPPLEPPEVSLGFHGFLVTPLRIVSVALFQQNSGQAAVATTTTPAFLKRAPKIVSWSVTIPRPERRVPSVHGISFMSPPSSLITNGTPQKGAFMSTPFANCALAAS